MAAFHDLKDVFQPKFFYRTSAGQWSSDGSLGWLFGVTPGSGDQVTPQFLSSELSLSSAKIWHKLLDFGSVPHRRHLVFFKMIWAALPGQHLVQKIQHLLQVLTSVPSAQLEGDNGDLLLVILEFHRVPALEGVRKTLPEWTMLIHTLTRVIPAFLLSSWKKKEQGRQFFKGLFLCFKHRRGTPENP